MGYRKALIIPDCHVPFECKRDYDLMLSVAIDQHANHMPFEEVCLLGDFADFYGVTLHEKNELPEFDFRHEVTATIHRLKQLRDLFPTSKITFIEGNHEFRLSRYLIKNAKELYGHISVPGLLQLDEFKIDWVPWSRYQKYQLLDTSLWARHRPHSTGKSFAVSSIAAGRGVSWVTGDTHRVQYAQENDIWGKPIEFFGLGWLGDAKASVYNYLPNHEQWMHAFGILTRYPTGSWNLDTVRIKDHECMYQGTHYVAPPLIENLSAAHLH